MSRLVNQGGGITGKALRLRVDVEIAHRSLFSQPVSVMNLEGLSKRLQIPFDGSLGRDILNQFRSVRFSHFQGRSRVVEPLS